MWPRVLCWLGRHRLHAIRPHWYGHLVGRCQRCGRLVALDVRRRAA